MAQADGHFGSQFNPFSGGAPVLEHYNGLDGFISVLFYV